jgi:hypothetical protein
MTIDAINLFLAIEWAVAAAIAFGAAFIALRYFKLSPLWALVVGMVIFTGMQFPLVTHATMAVIHRSSN